MLPTSLLFSFVVTRKNLAYNSSLIVSNVKLLGGLPGAFMSEVKCWGSGRRLQSV